MGSGIRSCIVLCSAAGCAGLVASVFFMVAAGNSNSLRAVSFVEEGHVYNISSELSAAGLIEVGLDTNDDGVYDDWTVTTKTSETYPIQYKTADTDHDKSPDLISIWIGRTDADDYEINPKFSYQQIGRDAEVGGALYRSRLVLGGDGSCARHYVYDDINVDGMLDTRQVYVGKERIESYIYFEDSWYLIEAVSRPYVVVSHLGQDCYMKFEEGAWVVAEVSNE